VAHPCRIFPADVEAATAAEDAAGGADAPFPLAPLVHALHGISHPLWQPDWPESLPPDSFRLTGHNGTWQAIHVQYPDGELRLRRRAGNIVEYPYLLGGVFRQVRAAWDSQNRLRTLVLEGENLLEIEVMAYDHQEAPSVFRLKSAAGYFFVSLNTSAHDRVETWFSPPAAHEDAPADETAASAGTATSTVADTAVEAEVIAVYYARLDPETGTSREITQLYPAPRALESRAYDSMGNVTAVWKDGRARTALYTAKGVVYWDGMSLQWDEAGLPARLAAASEPTEAAADDFSEARYEYRFDRRGNWTERLEIRMKAAPAAAAPVQALIPVRTESVRRFIEY
jgi:hypothetical protein